MKERLLQLDYLKGVFILLMVVFHLSLIEKTYPLLTMAVYTFHMSGFLIISGYVANIDKEFKAFARGLLRLVVPYVAFESIYILMLYFLGNTLHTNNIVDNLTFWGLVNSVVVHPLGPYWYLHTLIVCTVTYYIVYHFLKMKGMAALSVMGSFLYMLSLLIEGFGWQNAIYFMIGIIIVKSGKLFINVVQPSVFALFPLYFLFLSIENLNRGSLAGIAITILVISFLLFIYDCCSVSVKRFFYYLGKNSLAIVVFSPMFTAITKIVAPYFSFDWTAICFMAFSLPFIVICCLASAWIFDKLHISKYLFYKESFYSKF